MNCVDISQFTRGYFLIWFSILVTGILLIWSIKLLVPSDSFHPRCRFTSMSSLIEDAIDVICSDWRYVYSPTKISSGVLTFTTSTDSSQSNRYNSTSIGNPVFQCFEKGRRIKRSIVPTDGSHQGKNSEMVFIIALKFFI